MRIDIITVLPELLKSPFEASILKRAIEADLVEVHFHNLRDYATGDYKAIDDTQFGGGAGMYMHNELSLLAKYYDVPLKHPQVCCFNC